MTRLVVALFALVVVTSPALALAQQISRVPFDYISVNPVIISQQIFVALHYEQRALELLTATAPSPEAAEQIRALVYDSYVLVRYARQGVLKSSHRSRFPDPILQIEDDLMEIAGGVIRECMTALDHVRAGQSNDFGPAMSALVRAIAQLEKLRVLMP